MDNDVETMPIGTARLLRDLSEWLRDKHHGFVVAHDQAKEKAGQASGWRADAYQEDMAHQQHRADEIAERIGSIEALLDRCPHAPPLEHELFHCKAEGMRVISVERG